MQLGYGLRSDAVVQATQLVEPRTLDFIGISAGIEVVVAAAIGRADLEHVSNGHQMACSMSTTGLIGENSDVNGEVFLTHISRLKLTHLVELSSSYRSQ